MKNAAVAVFNPAAAAFRFALFVSSEQLFAD